MRIKLIKVSFLLLVVLASCGKRQNYNDVPSISFEDYKKYGNDSIKLTISYLDGDGDLGLGPQHSEEPYDSGKYANNLIVEHYERYDGGFHQTTQGPYPDQKDTFQYSYRFRNLTPEGKNKSIKGKISITLSNQLQAFTPNFPSRNYGGQLLFKIYLYDRALHKSNKVSSPAIPFQND